MTKEYPGTDGLHLGEMAIDLATHDVYMGAPILILDNTTAEERQQMTFSALMDRAYGRILANYQRMAEEQPEALQAKYIAIDGGVL